MSVDVCGLSFATTERHRPVCSEITAGQPLTLAGGTLCRRALGQAGRLKQL